MKNSWLWSLMAANSTASCTIDRHILNFTALSVVGVSQYSLLPLALCNLICDGLYNQDTGERKIPGLLIRQSISWWWGICLFLLDLHGRCFLCSFVCTRNNFLSPSFMRVLMGILNKLFGMKQPEPTPKLGRNDPCWCGSGKKYKKCHMDSDLRKQSRFAASSCRMSS